MRLYANLQREKIRIGRIKWHVPAGLVAGLFSGLSVCRPRRIRTGSKGPVACVEVAGPTTASGMTVSRRLRESILVALSHDLRGPLTSVVGLGESLLRSAPGLAPHQLDLANAMYGEAVRMNEMVSNLLDILRIENDAALLKQEWQVLEEVVGGALRISGQRLEGCRITTGVPADFPLLRFDAVLIERVLVNLIENAAKFTGPDAHIGIAANMRGAWAQISVYDNGPGIPAGDRQRLFECFPRCGQTAKKPGHGLGLSILPGHRRSS